MTGLTPKGNRLPLDEFPNRTTPKEAQELLFLIEARSRALSRSRRDALGRRLKDDGYRQSWHEG